MMIVILGGGAAGMMAAATLCEQNPSIKVLLFEKNARLGEKVLISGGGRCNVTTGLTDRRLLLERYPRGGKFLQSALYRFGPENVMDWFETHGVPLKTEKDGRVFPISNSGKDVVGVFEDLFQKYNVKVLLRHEVNSLQKKGEKFMIDCKNGASFESDKLILTTGGQAYRHTGSTGDGYAFAEDFGHTLTPLAASLNSFILKEKWPKELSGVSLSEVTLKVKRPKKLEWKGPILLTHRGITGPAVFALSSLVAFENYTEAEPLEILIDFVPTSSLEKVQEELRKEIQNHPKKTLQNSLGKWVPRSLAQALCQEVAHIPEKENTHLSKKEFFRLSEALKGTRVHAIGRSAGEEFVTAGGVDTNEVDPRTMESKLCPNLYFAGEILNIDGFTGGFNLQAAWSTGRMAGEASWQKA